MLFDFAHLDPAVVAAFVVSVVIPAVSATISRWGRNVAGVLTLVLAAANGFFSEWASAGNGYNWRQGLAIGLGSLFVAVLSHYGLWKDTQAESQLLALFTKKPVAVAPPVQPGAV